MYNKEFIGWLHQVFTDALESSLYTKNGGGFALDWFLKTKLSSTPASEMLGRDLEETERHLVSQIVERFGLEQGLKKITDAKSVEDLRLDLAVASEEAGGTPSQGTTKIDANFYWRRFVRGGVFILAAYAIAWLLPLPSYNIEEGAEFSCSRDGFIASFTDARHLKALPDTDAKVCVAQSSASVSYVIYVFSAGPDEKLNTASIQSARFQQTNARKYPHVFLDSRHLFSIAVELSTGQVTPDLFLSNDRKQGFLQYVASDTRAIFIVFASQTAVKPSQVFSSLSIIDSRPSRLAVLTKISLVLSPLLVLLAITVPSKFRQSFWATLDSFRASGFGVGFLFLLLSVALALPFAFFGFQTPGFAVALAVILLSGAIIARALTRRIRRPRIVPFSDPPTPLSTGYRRTVVNGYGRKTVDVTLVAWTPYSQDCRKCGAHYVLYTPSRVNRDVFDGSLSDPDESAVSEKLNNEMWREARAEATPPWSACPFCGGTEHLDEDAAGLLQTRAKRDMYTAMAFVAGGAIGSLVWLWVSESLTDKAPVVVDILNALGEFSPIGFQEAYIGGAFLLLLSLHAAYRVRTRRRRDGLWVCPADGFLFENLESQSEFEQYCPHCRQALWPCRDVELVMRSNSAEVSGGAHTWARLRCSLRWIIAIILLAMLALLPLLTEIADVAKGLFVAENTAPREVQTRHTTSDTDEWVLTLAGLGPIRLGMTLDQVTAATGARTVAVETASTHTRLFEVPGIHGLVMATDGKTIVAVWMTGPWKTLSGLRVGESTSRLRALYGSRVNELLGEEGRDPVFEFVPRDRGLDSYRVYFRTSGGFVAEICAGVLPYVADLCLSEDL